MALKIVRKLGDGEKLPTGYGVAWFEGWNSREVVCMPVPLNVLARLARDAWLYLATFSHEVPVNPRAAYMAGLVEGRMSLFDDAASMGVELGRRRDDKCS